ncbi:MAG: hypothetical protein RI897_3324 [Verrucomicrobiota bacterium]
MEDYVIVLYAVFVGDGVWVDGGDEQSFLVSGESEGGHFCGGVEVLERYSPPGGGYGGFVFAVPAAGFQGGGFEGSGELSLSGDGFELGGADAEPGGIEGYEAERDCGGVALEGVVALDWVDEAGITEQRMLISAEAGET